MKEKLKLLMHLTYNEAETMYNRGFLSDLEWRAWQEIWIWTASRFSSVCNADQKQDRYWTKYGKDRFYARIAKTRAAFGLPPLNPSPFTTDKN